MVEDPEESSADCMELRPLSKVPGGPRTVLAWGGGGALGPLTGCWRAKARRRRQSPNLVLPPSWLISFAAP